MEHNIDDGEPLGFEVLIEFTPPLEFTGDELDPDSPIAKALTLLCSFVGAPLPMCRLIKSADDFSSAYSTELLFNYRPQWEHWEVHLHETKRHAHWPAIDQGLCRALRTAWDAEKAGRLSGALLFFQHAWLAHDLEHMVLNLAVVLESLCAPHSQGETTHQISFNVAHLLGGDSDQKRATYSLIRRFYGYRSAIVHGGDPDWMKVQEITPHVFELVTTLLKRLLLNPQLARVFANEDRRRDLFTDYMFPR